MKLDLRYWNYPFREGNDKIFLSKVAGKMVYYVSFQEGKVF